MRRIGFISLALGAVAWAAPPLVYDGPLDIATSADGALRPVVGVQNVQVFRANRKASAHADGLTDTYNHAPMLCHWRGRFYVEYLSGPVNEHDNPTVTSLTTSVDGINWDAPHVIFPSITLPDGKQTIAHQRMGFYVAPDGRLLVAAFAGSRVLRVPLTDVLDHDWVLMPRRSASRKAFDRTFLGAGLVPPAARIETESFHIAMGLVAHTRMLAVVPIGAYRQQAAVLRRVAMAPAFAPSSVVMLTPKGVVPVLPVSPLGPVSPRVPCGPVGPWMPVSP